MKKKDNKTKTEETSTAKIKNSEKVKNILKPKKRAKEIINDCNVSKKDFRENPTVETFYKTIYEYKLREDAYKAAIEIHLNRLLKENPQK